MIKRVLVFSAITLLFASCLKSPDTKCTLTESTFVAPAAEVTTLQNYVYSVDPTATQHPSGFFYKISTAGTGTVTPAVCSNILVTYTGKLTNGTQFDQNTTGYSNYLGQLILGWQKGIPLIRKGGSIRLYIPPSLGYGATANGTIPANSILIFDVNLLDIQ
jgi:FKBP-type peptidyl-prolyl cis-trans isomerase FkpA